ncbi:glycosyltransferase family 4 protein [Streptomyces sp. NPDC086182]|uniref:glycosyltransferase family 4 protein n=1 Tax=Streptomyces sp. NPDC086182 TaxID=3155058 RepID=UPI003443BE8C
MTVSTPAPARGIVFVLASWQMNAPAGIERATAALAAALAAAGHRVAIATAIAPVGQELDGVTIEHLDISVRFPCSDERLRRAVLDREDKIQARLWEIITRHQADTVVFTDALWGLGRLAADLPDGVRRILAAHVLPAPEDAPAALSRADQVLVPSPVVRDLADAAGLPAGGWHVLPNALLHTPDGPPDDELIERRRSGPVRVLARLGPEKGIAELLQAAAGWDRPLEVRVAAAGFETATGSQARLLGQCRALADAGARITLTESGLPWREVPVWLAGASAVIVPSLRETFGLVALEAMSVGVPVIAHPVGNLPALMEHPYVALQLTPHADAGANTLLAVADALLADPVAYGRSSKAMYHLSQDYRPDRIALQFLKAVS